MKKSVFLIITLCIPVIISCGGESSLKREIVNMQADGRVYDMVQEESAPADVMADRKIMRQGSLTFETKDIIATRARIEKDTKELKGYIAQENAWTSDDRIQHNLELRVPAENFDLLITRVTTDVEKIENRNIGSQDVTEEFIDIEARLKTKKELENKYMELLKKAQKVEEILLIEKELGTLRSDIESIEGRLKYLNDQVSLSTLSVTYYQKIRSPFRFSSKFGDSLKAGWRNLMWFFIGLINLWPFILLGTVILVIIFRINKKRRIKKS